MKRLTALFLISYIIFSMMCHTTASAQGENSDELSEQITAKIKQSEYKLNEKTGSCIFQVNTELTNNSNAEIMDIQYRLHFLDKNDEEMSVATDHYNGQDTPLAPGKSAVHYRGGQFKATEKPKSITVEILSVKTTEEMPPIHVPQAGEYVYLALNDPNLENILKEPPVSVDLWIDHGGAREECKLTNPEDISKFVEAFTKIKIAEESEEWVTDNYNGLSMEFANGEHSGISLILYSLEYNIYGTWYLFRLADDGPMWQIIRTFTKPVVYDEYTIYSGS